MLLVLSIMQPWTASLSRGAWCCRGDRVTWVTAISSCSSFVPEVPVSFTMPFLLSSAARTSVHGDSRPMSEGGSLSLEPAINGIGFSFSSILEMLLAFNWPPRVFNSFSELGSDEEEDEDEEEEDEDEEEEQDEWTVLLLCGFSLSLLSDRSEVISVFSLLRTAFFSSSSVFRRLFTVGLTLDLDSAWKSNIKVKDRFLYFNRNSEMISALQLKQLCSINCYMTDCNAEADTSTVFWCHCLLS